MDFFEKHEISRPSRPYTERDFNSRIPRYNDDSDYTTNAPSYYDDLARKNQLLKTLSYRIWEYQEVINKQFNEWDEQIKQYFLEWQKNLEEFDEEVMKLLRQWIDDGTFADIINQEILSWKADKTYVDSEFSKVNNELSKKVNKSDIALNVKDFGALGDSINDDTTAFENAIDHLKNTGGVIQVPRTNGSYIISRPLDLTSNITIDGDNADIRLKGTRVLFTTSGTVSDRTAVTQNSKLGDHFITVSSTSAFKIGDYIKILSQRPATSEIGEYDQNVGHQTAATDRVYFGEIKKITAIDNVTGQLFFRGGLVFQDYLTHNNNETHPQARSNSTVDKVNYVNNVKIRGLNIYGDMGSFARFVMAKDALIENINWYDGLDGEMVSFRDSYSCTGRNINVFYDRTVAPSNHYARNALKTVSSVESGFEKCKVENGTQPVDFSYTAVDGIPNTNSFIKDSIMMGASDDGITTHGISIGPKIINNMIIDCNQHGISCRSRDAVITGNTVIGTWGEDMSGVTYGIALEQKGAKGAIVSDNRIKFFTVGVGWRDGEISRIREVNSIVSNNNMSFVNRGVQLRRVPGSDFLGRSNVRIQGNVMSDFIGASGRAIDIYERYFHIWIVDNTIIGNNRISGGVFSRGNSHAFHIDGNQFINVSDPIWFLENDDPEIIALPNGQKYYYYGMNNYYNGAVSFEKDAGLYRTHYNLSAGLRPSVDDSVSLGHTSQRWAQVYATSGVINTSDRDYKKDIKASDLGLNFVDQLNPVTFKYKKGERTHYGLIAQEVEKTVNDMGIDTTDFGVLTKDENGYGMRYTELIPILIKSIQELNDKLK